MRQHFMVVYPRNIELMVSAPIYYPYYYDQFFPHIGLNLPHGAHLLRHGVPRYCALKETQIYSYVGHDSIISVIYGV